MADAELDKIDKGTATGVSDTSQGAQGSDSPTDDQGQDASASPTDDIDLGDDGKPLPFDKNPKWKSARLAEKNLQRLMRDNEVDDIDDLVELVSSGKKVMGKVDPDALDTIIDKAATLSRYEEYWAQQAEDARRAEEDPDATVARVTRENDELRARMNQQKAVDDNQRALSNYDSFVAAGVREVLPNIPPEQSKFLAEFLGVGNPAVEVDITNKSAVGKVVRDGVKKFEKFKQQIIKDYLAGKETVLNIPRTDTGTTSNTGEIKNLKEARKAFLAHFTGSP